MKWRSRAALILAGAAAGFVGAGMLVRERPDAQPVAVNQDAPMEKRFPEHTEQYRSPSREEPRWRELRGHAFSLKEREETEDPRWNRLFAGLPKLRPRPARCAGCHASVADARQSVGCVDCHERGTLALRITRPAFTTALAAGRAPTHQEMRSYVCAQCHSEYFFAGAERAVAHPWARGLKAEEVEAFYDEAGVSEWVHAETGAGLIRVRHPQFEMWRQGIHARSGVACADCHMARTRRGAMQVSDHRIGSPLTRIPQACLRCHAVSETEMKARVAQLRERYGDLEARAAEAITGLLDEVYAARERGASESALEPARRFQRKAMVRLGFAADGSRGFHAPEESARLFGEAIDFARRGEMAAAGAAR